MKQIANIVRIGERFIVADKESYLLLKSIQYPSTVIPVALLESAKTALSYKNIEFVMQDFELDILQPFLKRARASWASKNESFTSQSQTGMLILDASSQGAAAAYEIAPKIEDVMTTFFRRWGFKHNFEISESRGKVRISIEYFFDQKANPVIELAKDAKEFQKYELELGFFKISLSLDDPNGRIANNGNSKEVQIGYVHYTVQIKQGGTFVPYKSGRCTYGEVSSVLPFMSALTKIADNQPNNQKPVAESDD